MKFQDDSNTSALAFVLALGLACPSSACSPSAAPEDAPTVRSALIGGEESTSAATVEVVIQLKKNPTPETSFSCTGVVVSPHVVLTAAHCVSPQTVTQGQSWFIFKGSDSNDATQIGNRRNFGYAKEVRFDPAWKLEELEGGHDIGAVVVLDKLSIEPVRLNRSALTQDTVGSIARLVGYGVRKAGDVDSSGHRDEATLPIAGLNDLELWFTATTRAPALCEGDSGGPSFLNVNGSEVLVGIHSHVEHVRTCTGKMFDTRVDLYVESFIDPLIREVDPGFLESQSPLEGDTGAADASETPSPNPAPAAGTATTAPGGCSLGSTVDPRGNWGIAAIAATLMLVRRRTSRKTSRRPGRR